MEHDEPAVYHVFSNTDHPRARQKSPLPRLKTKHFKAACGTRHSSSGDYGRCGIGHLVASWKPPVIRPVCVRSGSGFSFKCTHGQPGYTRLHEIGALGKGYKESISKFFAAAKDSQNAVKPLYFSLDPCSQPFYALALSLGKHSKNNFVFFDSIMLFSAVQKKLAFWGDSSFF